MASHEGSRKRMKISRTEGKPSATSMASTATASTSVTEDVQNYHAQALKTLHTDIDSMRQLVTCKICDRFLYEPYVLSCGHTYCYSCLREWLVSNRKKSCPDCRAVITQQPTPSYVIRELVLVFCGRNELLPDGETTEEHNALARDEAKIVADDKANTDPRDGGLFKGCFTHGRGRMLLPIRDPGDGVDRCPQCHWEVEDGFCNHCGLHVDGHEHLGLSDDDISDSTDDDMDHELDMEDVDAVWGADGQDDYVGDEFIDDYTPFIDGGPPPNNFVGRGGSPNAGPRARAHRVHGYAAHRSTPIEIWPSSEDESEDDENDPTMDGFIENDDHIEYESSDDGSDTDVPGRSSETQGSSRSHRRAHVISDDEDDETAASAGAGAGAGQETEQDSDEDLPRALGSQRHKRNRLAARHRPARTISSEVESSDDDNEHESDILGIGGFSPLDSAAGDAISNQTDYDSEGSSSVRPPYGDIDSEDDDGDDSDDSDDTAGWGPVQSLCNYDEIQLTNLTGTQAETPADSRRHPPSAYSHRTQTLGRRSNRHILMPSVQLMPAASPSFAARGDPAPYRRNLSQAASRHIDAPPQPLGIRQPQQSQLLDHPFQLYTTLANINSNASTQQHRSGPVHRNISSESSRSHSSIGGGVNVQSSSSSGSGSTIGPSTAGRRKRLLSISSDESVEDNRRYYRP